MKTLIIGGVAGGATAAARLRRMNEEAEIILFEKGKNISYANCGLPYYIGDVIKEKEKILLQSPQSFKSRYNVEVRVQNEVVDINREKRVVTVKDLKTGKEYTESYDKIILSPGAEVILPPVKGIDNEKVFSIRKVSDAEKINSYIDEQKPKHAIIVGGGYIGLEMAENLNKKGLDITLLEMAQQLVSPLDFEMAAEVHQHLKTKNIEFYLKEQLVEIEEKNGRLNTIFKSGDELNTDMIVVAVGIKPNTKLAEKAGLKTGESGGIAVDSYMNTSDENIYAVGDAIEAWDPVFHIKRSIPLAGPANKQARIAADNIVEGNRHKFSGSVGTAIAKVFDISVGVTGFSEKFLDSQNIKFESVIIHRADHAGYYPGSNPISIKLNFDHQGKVLGAQVVGFSGVDKALETLSMACQYGMTVYNLKDMDQAYAPPFSSAKSPVNIAGFVADNVLKERVKTVSWQQVKNSSPQDTFILDIRTPEEFQMGRIGGSVNIPLDDLRERLDEIPKDKKIYTYCAVGQRSYLACRILMQSGFEDVYNISGGYKTWENASMKQSNRNVKENTRIDKDETIYSASAGIKQKESLGCSCKKIDATGLQCPGPIMKLNSSIHSFRPGTQVEISASDQGFYRDIESWCSVTGNRLISRESENGVIKARIEKQQEQAIKTKRNVSGKEKTLVVFSDDMDRALASFVIANGALSMGKEVTVFFTFWGLNVIKKKRPPRVKKDFISKMFSFMLPKGANKLKLSKLHLGGMGSRMMKGIMKKKNIETLDSLLRNAKQAGARFIACQMSMDVMGIKGEELMDGVEVGGVASYIEATEDSNLNLFI